MQITSEASKNGGCGLIVVSEMKNGIGKYTNPDGSFGPLLSYHDPSISGSTYRKADEIYDIPKCRIQMVTAGVRDD